MSTPPPPDPSRPFDVAIAGAGLAGGSLALRLAGRGMRVALVDAHTFPRDKLCGEFLSPECWGMLDRLGLAGEVARSGYHPIRRVRLTTPRGRVLEAEVIGTDGRPGIGLSRAVLDDLIVRRARGAGAELFEGTRVGGPIVRDGRVVGLRARHPSHGPMELHAKVVVAADGRHSSLVRQTGTMRKRSLWRPRLFGLKRHLTLSEPHATALAETVELHCVPGGYVGACRIEEVRANLCGLLPESALRPHRGDLDRLAADWFGRNPALSRLWEAAMPSGDWKTVAGTRVEVSTPRRPGILYAGDCQGTVDPLGGQGMTMALLGAEALAPFIEQGLVSGVDRSLQRTCQVAWQRRFDGRVRLCRLCHHALVNPLVIDLATAFRTFAPRVLAGCFTRTRDQGTTPG